ncbi:hypothetical protein Cfor_02367, partial [Coptotermes formosanus]
MTRSIALLEGNKRDSWFQQDGETALTANRTHFLQHFGDRIVGLWFRPSPLLDFMPPDFLLWEFFKERIYRNNPRILEYLQDNTEQCVAGIGQTILRNIATDAVKIMNISLQEVRERFENLL